MKRDGEKNEGAAMTGRTHLAVGAAAAMLVAGPAAGLVELAIAAGGGAVGAVLPDLDVRDTAHPWRERLARVGAAALLICAIMLDAAHGGALMRAATTRHLGAVALGVVALAGLTVAARLSSHRGFSHSLVALTGLTAATWLVCPPLAPSVALGLATHLALDALTYRGLRLFWPLRSTLSARLCKTGGVIDACLLAGALVAGALVVSASLW